MRLVAVVEGTVPVFVSGGDAEGLEMSASSSMQTGGPQSPLDLKPDTATLLAHAASAFSPGSTGPNSPSGMSSAAFSVHSSAGGYMSPSNLSGKGPGGGSGGTTSPTNYPPNHPLSGSKHLCSICGDRASGKHYGVYSCEGCKGFFKRTVRKDLTYACREDRNCIIDKRQRNRCQYCRYQKCLAMGMKREAVQEERQRTKEKGENEVESTSGTPNDMPVERFLEAEKRVETREDHSADSEVSGWGGVGVERERDDVTNICQAADKQLIQLVEWAKHIPHFTDLPLDDQVCLLRAGWNELLIAAFSHRSMEVKDGILLASGLLVQRNSAHGAGVGSIFDRVLTELVAKMREMRMDKTELGCLRAIVLFNPEAKGLRSVNQVMTLREKVFVSLEEYCKQTYPEENGRFAKLLLRLPALRSIGLKCLEHLFFFKLIGDTPLDTLLMEMLEAPADP
ncbi:unnamed protein product [Darwinula stevensoni]|uniref:Nuclear receptor subfamily 2 group B member 4 n=1 Tax=Darwinula stevensoni TaxID=69355 RepID=A0A7R9FNS6_9CRUS|nr:unnamed protein product [Darwinula stevensoni]CAG0897074.1 unnamed protein product [Darwinula stevensoni]